jgi:hypothetical protein
VASEKIRLGREAAAREKERIAEEERRAKVGGQGYGVSELRA